MTEYLFARYGEGGINTVTNDANVTGTIAGSNLALGWTGTLSGSRGGTGVNNGSSTITIGGNVAFSGAYTFAGTLTANTAVTFPTSGTLLTANQTITLSGDMTGS